jgi:hypothetical protein
MILQERYRIDHVMDLASSADPGLSMISATQRYHAQDNLLPGLLNEILTKRQLGEWKEKNGWDEICRQTEPTRWSEVLNGISIQICIQ